MQPIQSLMLCSHLTSAFVSMSSSKFIASMVMQMQMQRMAFSASRFTLLLPMVTQMQRMDVDPFSLFTTINLMLKFSQNFNTHSLIHDECILISDELICTLFAQMDKLKFGVNTNTYSQ